MSSSQQAQPSSSPSEDVAATDAERAALAEGIDLFSYRHRWPILFVLCLSLMGTMLANTSLGVALPMLSRDLGATTAAQQWFSNAYALVFAGLLFVTSTLADRYGRKPMLLWGLVIFGAVSVYVALFVHTSGELIAARGALGLASAMIMPVTLSILTNVFPRDERARAVGLWAAVSGAGTALGPVIAGVLIQYYSWESVFVINVPVVILAIIGGLRYLPSKHSGLGEHGALDIPGAILSTAGITLVVYALIQAQHVGWTALITWVFVAIGLVLLAVFVWWELRAESPMLDPRLFRNRGFAASAIALTLVFFSLIGVFFSLSQTLQLVYGYSPLTAAFAMLPTSIMMMTIAPQASRVVAKFGPRATISLGLVLAAVGMAGLGFVNVDSSYPHLLVPLVIMSAGLSLAMSPATDQLMANVPRERAGMGSATNDVTREVGASLGVAVLGSVLSTGYAASLSDSLGGLPAEVQDAAKNSLFGGLAVAQSLGERGAAFTQDVLRAWLDGMHVAQLAGAGLIVVAAIIAWVWLPRTTDTARSGTDAADEEQASAA